MLNSNKLFFISLFISVIIFIFVSQVSAAVINKKKNVVFLNLSWSDNFDRFFVKSSKLIDKKQSFYQLNKV